MAKGHPGRSRGGRSRLRIGLPATTRRLVAATSMTPIPALNDKITALESKNQEYRALLGRAETEIRWLNEEDPAFCSDKLADEIAKALKGEE